MTPGAVAVVTGGARRLGAAICRALAADGWRVGIGHAASTDAGRALAAELGAERALAVPLDLRDDHAPADAIARVVAHFGRLDLVVNNAAVFPDLPLAAVDAAHVREVLQVNVVGALAVSLAARSHLAATRGSIVNLCDIHGERPLRGRAVYSMSKAALIMQTRALALEFAPEIRVNGINPGAILWPENAAPAEIERARARIPLGHAGEPADIARAVLYLAGATYVTGEILTVDGGRSLG